MVWPSASVIFAVTAIDQDPVEFLAKDTIMAPNKPKHTELPTDSKMS